MVRGLLEVGAAACAAIAGWGAGALAGGAEMPRLGAAAGLGVALGAMQLALIADRRATGGSMDPAQARRLFDQRAAGTRDPRDRASTVAQALAQLLESWFRLAEVRVLFDEELGDAGLDPRVRTWLVANNAPIAASHLDELRLGGLREPVARFVRGLSADLVLPLVHRDRLVAIATGRGRVARLLRGRRGAELGAVQQAAAGALGELRLLAVAARQAEVTREVEAAVTVQRETAAATARASTAGCRVVRHYAPSRQFSGAWWCARELPDGRLFAGIGEVTGRGVAAALLSATAMGVCESATRVLGGGVELHGVLELLHGAVRGASGGAFGMSAVVALVDREAGLVTFASAGHPFPFLVRPAPLGREGARGSLRSLVSRGTHLASGEQPIRALGSAPISAGDVLVFYTGSLTDARNGDGQTFGERRLQHILRRASLVGPVGPDGSDLVDQIAEDVAGHIGGRAPDDDVLVATVEVL